ncbi:hypothetical protein RZS08_45550, partial [Arthrospira platensis SPKY1]|nr:hypothetical protein [Arthrospira platensis SPKY1]
MELAINSDRNPPLTERELSQTRRPHDAPYRRRHRLAAEFLGAATLVAVVVGSGIMASRLTDDVALVLLVNAVSTVAGLGVLIWVLG